MISRPTFGAIAVALVMALPMPARAVDPSPVVPPGVEAYARATHGEVLEIVVFEGDFSGDGVPDALGFIYYALGGGNSFGLDVSLFETAAGELVHRRTVPEIFGMEPRDVAVSPGRIEVTTTMPRPGDPRCCPTGSARYTITP